MEWLSELDKVLTMSNAGMVFCACIVVGYLLRVIPQFPNKSIPIAVILTGGIAMLLLAEDNKEIAIRAWITRHLIGGLTIGFISWMAHYLVMSKIEDFLAKRFNVVAKVLSIDPNKEPKENE